MTEVEKLENLLRWHAVALEAVIKTPPLCHHISKKWNVRQDLWPDSNFREQNYDLPAIVASLSGRKALLHAVAIQQTVEQLPRGRAHSISMPSSLFAASSIYGLFSFVGQHNVRMPSSIEWADVVLAESDLHIENETGQYIQSNRLTAGSTSRNVLYELNSVQKLFRSLATQWGISSVSILQILLDSF